MVESDAQRRYRVDAKTLAAVGQQLSEADLPDIEVRLPKPLAELAVAAWERDEDGQRDVEDFEQAVQRGRAATLALIGLSIVERGRIEGDEIVVALDPGLVGGAINAADESS
jgi:hypothetical protein